MRLFAVGLLALLLAACGDPEEPAPKPEANLQPTAEQQAAEDAAQRDRQRADWLQIEHPGWSATDLNVETDTPTTPVEVPAVAVLPPPASSSPHDQLPSIGLIIDDVGHSLVRGRRLIALPVPVALAILPHTQAAGRLAAEASAAGKTVMLHQPMENGAALPIGAGGLYVGMPRAELEQTLQHNLNDFIPIQGVNNHMGSRLTTQRREMDWVMQVLKARGLFFIDSRTSKDTQAAFAAEAQGVRYLSRDVFLDNERTEQAIDAAFSRALALARKQGSALIIGHPYPETLNYLERRLPGLQQEEGVVVVSVEELLARKYRR